MGISPLVSIIVPVCNGEKYLSEAIESILAQAYCPLEIIVVDDGSTDRTSAIAKRFFPSVKYWYQANAGTGAARNRGVELAQGSFFAFLDADDLWLQDKLTIQMGTFCDNPETEIVFGYVKQFYSPELDDIERSKLRCPDQAMPGFLPCTMVIRREAFFQVGLFETNWRLGQDVSWIIRAREQGLRAVMVPQPVYMRRLHKNNKGVVNREFSKDRIRILKASLDRKRLMQCAIQDNPGARGKSVIELINKNEVMTQNLEGGHSASHVQIDGRVHRGADTDGGELGDSAEPMPESTLPLFERLLIESQSNCNRSCWFCPRTYDRSGTYIDEKGRSVIAEMPTEMVLNLLDQAQGVGFRRNVTFCSYSEPLLDKRNIMFALEAKKRGMTPYLHSNGDMLKQDDRLCREIRDAYEYIVIGLYDYRTNEELESAKQFWLKRLAGVNLKFSLIGSSEACEVKSMAIPRALVPTDSRIHVPDLTFSNAPCHRPLLRMIIRYDGEMCNCCEDAQGVFHLGNAYKNTLEELWFSELHVRAIRDLIEGRRDNFSLCRDCPQSPTGHAPRGMRIKFSPRNYTLGKSST